MKIETYPLKSFNFELKKFHKQVLILSQLMLI